MHNTINIDTRVQLLIENVRFYIESFVKPINHSIYINNKFSLMEGLKDTLTSFSPAMLEGDDETSENFANEIIRMTNEYNDVSEKMNMLNKLSLNEIRLILETKNTLSRRYHDLKHSHEPFSKKDHKLHMLFDELVSLMQRSHHFFQVYQKTSQDLLPNGQNMKNQIKHMADLMPSEFNFDMKILEKLYVQNDLSLDSVERLNLQGECTSLNRTIKFLRNKAHSKLQKVEEGLNMMSTLLKNNDLFGNLNAGTDYTEMLKDTENFYETSKKNLHTIMNHYEHLIDYSTDNQHELNEFMYNTLLRYVEDATHYEDWIEAKLENQKNIVGSMMEKSFELISSFMQKMNP